MYFLKDLSENFLDLANPPVSVSVCLSCSGWKNCFIEWDFQVEHVFLPEKFLKTHSFICHDDLIYYKIFFFGEERRVEERAVKYFIRSLLFTAWGGAGGGGQRILVVSQGFAAFWWSPLIWSQFSKVPSLHTPPLQWWSPLFPPWKPWNPPKILRHLTTRQ